jgi:hypothetical protein
MNLYKTIQRKDLVRSLVALGNEVSFLVEGHIGSSKSSLLHDLSELLPTHTPVYIDMACITDAGDFQLPALDHDNKVSRYYPNESLGLHTDAPMIIMFDELGKAGNQGVINAVLPALNERRWGNRYFHPDTIVFATTNLGTENVGDLLKPHAINRIVRARMAKPTAMEYLQYEQNHNIHPIVAAWVDRNPQCFASYDEVNDPADNEVIYHPKVVRPAFVTHRSMSRASKIMHKREVLGDDAITHLLCGTIGAPAALSMMTFAALSDQLPTRQEILANPEHAQVPDSPAAMVLLACQALSWVDRTTLTPWIKYLNRFVINEPKALFALQLTHNKAKVEWASKVQAFTDFNRQYAHLYGA